MEPLTPGQRHLLAAMFERAAEEWAAGREADAERWLAGIEKILNGRNYIDTDAEADR